MAADQFGNVFACDYLRGIIRTTNGGNTWTDQNVGLLSGSIPTTYAALGDSEFLIGTYPTGLYRTSNQGQNWTPILGLPENSGRIGAVREISSGNILLGSIDNGMFRSTDNGVSWSEVTTFPIAGNSWIRDIKVLHTGRILVTSETEGVYKSDDNGIHWNLLLKSQFNYFESIGTTGKDTVYVFSAIDGIYRSTNNGDSWNLLGPFNMATRSMVCYSNGDVFVFAAGKGPLVLRAGASDWEFLHIPSLSTTSIATRGNNIYVGAYPKGFFQSNDGGKSWSESILNEAYDIKINRADEVFAAVSGGRVWKSTDNGNSWQYALKATMNQADGYSLAFDTSGNIFAGIGESYYADNGGSIFKSMDDGSTWQEVNEGLGGGSIMSLLVTDDNTILAADNFHGIYRSTNDGSTWQLSSNGLPSGANFLSEILTKDAEGRIFCGTIYNGIFVSNDDGLSWHSSNSGMAATRVLDILPLGSGKLFAATLEGVFSSTDNGANWKIDNGGIPNPYIMALAVDSLGYLYAGTWGTGIYKSAKSVTSVNSPLDEKPKSFSLFQNYPNPFNPMTTIRFDVPVASDVSLKIYDILGREVAVLANDRKQPGHYETRWNAASYASGVYFYRLQANGFVETKKLLLMK
jgi:photosystem II stability/assembly factor-like uncharacterized protein